MTCNNSVWLEKYHDFIAPGIDKMNHKFKKEIEDINIAIIKIEAKLDVIMQLLKVKV